MGDDRGPGASSRMIMVASSRISLIVAFALISIFNLARLEIVQDRSKIPRTSQDGNGTLAQALDTCFSRIAGSVCATRHTPGPGGVRWQWGALKHYIVRRHGRAHGQCGAHKHCFQSGARRALDQKNNAHTVSARK